MTYNCTACEERTCPPILFHCPGRTAIDPCGCCRHCAKQEMEPCGGEDWEVGYCDKRYKCAAINGTGLVEIPNIGICKYLKDIPWKDHWEDDDEMCPVQKGCYWTAGMCDCVTKRTCIYDFFQYSKERCQPRFDYEPYFDKKEESVEQECYTDGCNIIDGKCVCESAKCGHRFEFRDKRKCNEALVNQMCANVTCPEVTPIPCPTDSVLSKPYTPHGECCPTVPSFCTCDFNRCNNDCPEGKRKILIQKTDGIPGSCCDKFLCLF
ncbi:cysteine-rich motor neuron 1 protein-like [Rhinophrynus dorsalis]